MKMNSREFYDRFSVGYEAYAERRRAYLSAVDALVCQKIRTHGIAKNIADIGCGTASRSIRIAHSLSIPSITVVDSSHAMLRIAGRHKNCITLCEDVARSNLNLKSTYDIVLCLWNVLGHVTTNDARVHMLRNLAGLLTRKSLLFLDVNNLYNFSAYGFFNVLRNIMLDAIPFRRYSGDFVARISVERVLLETPVHLFSHQEISRLFKKVGLKIVNQYTLNYETGDIMRSKYTGQLLYVLALL